MKRPRSLWRRGPVAGRVRRQPIHAGPAVLPTLLGAGGSFAFAAHERLLWPQVIGAVLVGLVVVSFLDVLSPLRIEVRVDAPDRVAVGEPFETSVRLTNLGSATRRNLVVRHRIRAGRRLVPDLVGLIDALPGRGEATVAARRTPTARGVATHTDVHITQAGAFGLFSRSSAHRIRHPLTCLPQAAAPVNIEESGGAPAGSAMGATPDVDVRGIREWRSGDQLSDVHWRSTIRTGRPAVLDRERRGAGSLVAVVMVAAGSSGRAPRDAEFESALAMVAATATDALRRGVPTCIVAQTAGFGYRHPSEESSTLDSFASIDVTDVPTPDLLSHAFGHVASGGTVLLVANSAVPAFWRTQVDAAARNAQVAVIDVVRWAQSAKAVPG